MNSKPTYEELERKVKKLEQEKFKSAKIKDDIVHREKWPSYSIESNINREVYNAGIELESIINAIEIQSIMDDFYCLTGMGTAVLDLKGRVIEATGWQDICTKFHRVNQNTLKNCTESDLFLAKNLKPGEYVEYKCKNGLWDVVTPLYVGTKHLGNIFTGQFFYDDEQVDEAFFIKQAEKFEFDKDLYMDAFHRIPRYNRETIKNLMSFLVKFTTYISKTSLAKIQLEKEAFERKQAEEALRESEKKYRTLFDMESDAIALIDVETGNMLEVNKAFISLYGYSREKVLQMKNTDFSIEPDKTKKATQEHKKVIPIRWHKKKDGTVFPTEIAANIFNNQGKDVHIAAIRDITERNKTEEHLNFLSSITERLSDSILVTNNNFEITYINKAFEKLYGYSLAELKGKTPDILNAEPAKEKIQQELYETVARGETFLGESLNKKKDGSEFYCEYKVMPLKNKDNEIYAYTGIQRDITERKETEDKLKDNQNFLDSILDQSPYPTWISDTKGTMIRANPALKKVLNLSDEQLIGKYNVFQDDQIEPHIIKMVKDTLENGKTNNFELDWIGEKAGIDGIEKGSRVYCEGTIFPIHDQKGDITNAVITYKDSTEKKQAEEEILRFKIMSDNANYGSAIADLDGSIIYINDYFAGIHGYAAKELIGKNLNIFHNKEQLLMINRLYEKLLATGSYELSEVWHVHKYGAEFPMLMSGVVINDKNDKPQYLSATAIDISDRKKLELQLQQSQKMETIGTLAGGIAHDFNNILFPIVGYTEMLLEEIPEDSSLRDSLEEIFTGTMRASDLVKQILTFSRQDSNQIKLIKIQPIIKEALKLIRSTIPTSIEINQDIRNDCGIIKADPTQIHQIVMNLATNAYHAMENDDGELKVSLNEIKLDELDVLGPDMPPGIYACLTVADTGIGIDEDITEKIFDPFFTTKETGKGTGMGLSVVHGIVKNAGGSIHVYSELGKGTEFHVYLPVVKSYFEQQKAQTTEAIHGGTERILLVDDEDAIIRMEQQMLERLGYQVDTRSSSVEALEAFRAGPKKFDVVITDMAMPNMSGDKLAAELIKIRPDIPILLCTGFSEKISEERAVSMGIKDVLMKPIVRADLSSKIRKVLDDK